MSFAFLDCSCFKTNEWWNARITALALPDQTFNSSSCLQSLLNATPRQLNFLTGPASTINRQFAENIGQDFSREVGLEDNTGYLPTLILLFISISFQDTWHKPLLESGLQLDTQKM